MTGYASAQHSSAATSPGGEGQASPASRLGIEIRAVNSRYLDLTFKLSEELRSFEPALRELLVHRLRRGKVEVRAALENSAANLVAEPSVRLLQRLSTIQDNVRTWLPQITPLSLADVLRLTAGGSATEHDWQADLLALADQVLTSLLAAREREGARLVLMLQDRMAQLRELAAQAGPLVPQLVAQQRQRFLDRWRDAMGLVEGGALPEAAQDRALAEATAFAIRIDVAEELTRLNSHLDELDRLLVKGGEVGKRLDFLIQELHREANTLGSKSAALELTHISVDMKVLIEQMREQVQNIE
ncbi:MAG: hypothetical protein RL300_547 [Pseudomonadota bacterium]